MAKAQTQKGLTPAAAVDRLEELYAEATAGARRRARPLSRAPASRRRPSTRASFRYPLLRVIYRDTAGPRPRNRRAFAKLQRPGVYETTITHPGAFRRYLLEQLAPLHGRVRRRDRGRRQQPGDPLPLRARARRRDRPRAASPPASSPAISRRRSSPPSATRSPTASGSMPEGEPRPLSLFDAARVDYSLRRLVHYTGSDWRNVQRWILLTNYHRYVDQFVRWGREQLRGRRPPTSAWCCRAASTIERGDSPDAGRRASPPARRGTASRCRPIT